MRSFRPSVWLRLAIATITTLAPISYAYAADSVTASVVPGITVNATTTLVTGVDAPVNVRLPAGLAPIAYAYGSAGGQLEKMWVRQITLTASTSTDLDLTALTGGQGDTSFAKVKILGIYNNEAVTSGATKTVTVGNVTNGWVGPFGAATHTMTVASGCALLNFNKETAGWAVVGGTGDLLRLTPGAANTSVTVVIAGN